VSRCNDTEIIISDRFFGILRRLNGDVPNMELLNNYGSRRLVMFNKILVCLDGSELAEQIIPFVIEQANCFHSKVVLVHTVHEPVILSPDIPGSPGVPIEMPGAAGRLQKEQDEAYDYLEKAAVAFRENGLETESVVLEGVAGEAIVSYANNNNIDLIAVATHGRTGLRRAVLGSVTDYILRESGLPVLVIRPKESES
jgi:nucleotide-binding universal stress UspA family protein